MESASVVEVPLTKLCLTRQPNESVMVGAWVRVTVVSVHGDKVRLLFEAPRDVAVDRQEIRERKERRKKYGME